MTITSAMTARTHLVRGNPGSLPATPAAVDLEGKPNHNQQKQREGYIGGIEGHRLFQYEEHRPYTARPNCSSTAQE
jgi:hypothetical protein